MNTYPVNSKKIASESYSSGLSIANESIILIQGFVTSLSKQNCFCIIIDVCGNPGHK